MIDLEAIEGRLAVITPGEWKKGRPVNGITFIHGRGEGNGNIAKVYFRFGTLCRPEHGLANAEFLANAPGDIDALLAEVWRGCKRNIVLRDQYTTLQYITDDLEAERDEARRWACKMMAERDQARRELLCPICQSEGDLSCTVCDMTFYRLGEGDNA